MPTTPAPGSAANASTTRRACATASGVGVNTSLMTGTCAGMDRHLGGEAVAPRFLRFAPQAGVVAEIDIDRVDRLHVRGRGAGKAQLRASR